MYVAYKTICGGRLMEIKKFITTIQWGKGMHYIADTFEDENQIEHSINFHKKSCERIKAHSKKSPKATVRAWKLIEEEKS